MFGFTGTDGITATGLTGNGLFQSADFERAHDEEQIKNSTGDLATRVFYNKVKKATIEWIPSSTVDVAGARTAATTVDNLYLTILNITACADEPALVDTNWLVVGVKKALSNTGAQKITLTLENHDNITATPA